VCAGSRSDQSGGVSVGQQDQEGAELVAGRHQPLPSRSLRRCTKARCKVLLLGQHAVQKLTSRIEWHFKNGGRVALTRRFEVVLANQGDSLQSDSASVGMLSVRKQLSGGPGKAIRFGLTDKSLSGRRVKVRTVPVLPRFIRQ
jgi:hypothetical protein